MTKRPHGGARPGAGRPRLPVDERKIDWTVCVPPWVRAHFEERADTEGAAAGELAGEALELAAVTATKGPT